MSGLEWIEQGEEFGQSCVRHSFRVPIDENLKVSIDGQEVDAVNFSDAGVGVRVEDTGNLGMGDHLELGITIHGQHFCVNGHVVHFSAVNGDWLCGIKFVDVDKKNENQITEYIEQRRSVFFTNE